VLQYPGRQDRRNEQHFGAIGNLADQITDVIGSVADRPFAFFGHSMGGTTAFEVARRLERGAGDPPVMLFVSARRGPATYRDEHVHEKGDGGLIAEINLLSGTDPRVLLDEEILQMILPAMRADYRAIETYRYEPGPPLQAPITALAATEDPRTTVEEMKAWGEHTTGGFELHVLDGGHFYLNDRRAEVAKIVTDRLC